MRVAVLALMVFVALAGAAIAQSTSNLFSEPKPPDAPREWKELVGIYLDEDSKHVFVLFERDRKLFWRDEQGVDREFSVHSGIVFPPSEGDRIIGHTIARDGAGNVTGFCYLNFCYGRTDAGSDPSRHLNPVRPVANLRKEALVASPPKETGTFRKRDLADLATLDPTIRLDIRYATSNDFLGTPVYTQERAFLQRPATEALLRVHKKLKSLGYGLLIHDAYRPWYVTKIFWDATPPESKLFVADPAQGSRHNRGCAVDITLYDLVTGNPIEMPGTYDEMTPRSFPDYPGGTSLQRWHRDLLRRTMESEDFTVYKSEWWHFDYKDWREYPILNVSFEKLDLRNPSTSVH